MADGMNFRLRLTSVSLLLLLALGCGNQSEQPEDVAAAGMSAGTYEAGRDIPVGVYVARGSQCAAYTAKTRDFDIMDEHHDPDAFVAASDRVGELMRIQVRQGEFLTTECDRWHLEEGPDRTPDPTTLSGACTILLGEDDLVRQVVDALEAAPSAAEATPDGWKVQDRLVAVVSGRNPKIWLLAGELVDYLDAPRAFVTNGRVDPEVRETIRRIDARCATR